MLYRVRVGLLQDEHYRAIDPASTVVFVMNHRSNMDYVLVAFLAAERTTLSYAVGEWAKIWPLHMLFRFMGAFFVRRNSGNPLYRRVLERYIHMATQEGVCQAVFLEGGLSRDGRLKGPKLGLMDYMLRQFDPQRDRDIVFIPVGINYDRTIEDRSLLRSLNPDTRRRSLWYVFKTTTGFILRNLVLMALSRWQRYGYACVNFGTPLSIKAYCRETGTVFSQLERKDRFPKVEILCQRLMGAIADVIPVLPVSLVSAVFLEAPTTDLDILEIERRANKLINELQKNKAPVLESPRSTRMAAIADAIELMQLRGLIGPYGRSVRGRSAGDAGPALLCQCHRPLVDNAIDGGKPQTRCLSHRFGREKREDMGKHFCVQSRPVITYRQLGKRKCTAITDLKSNLG
jgi:glycerol-3-phosphate O-acyltransferase